MGAYVHGLFAGDRQRAAWLAMFSAASELNYEATVERTLDALADHCESPSRPRRDPERDAVIPELADQHP